MGDDLADVGGAVRRRARRGGDLVERCGGLLEVGGLLFGAAGEVVRRAADLGRCAVDGERRLHHIADRVAQFAHGGIVLEAQMFGRPVQLGLDL